MEFTNIQQYNSIMTLNNTFKLKQHVMKLRTLSLLTYAVCMCVYVPYVLVHVHMSCLATYILPVRVLHYGWWGSVAGGRGCPSCPLRWPPSSSAGWHSAWRGASGSYATGHCRLWGGHSTSSPGIKTHTHTHTDTHVKSDPHSKAERAAGSQMHRPKHSGNSSLATLFLSGSWSLMWR